jgi:hypothetical protein
MSMPNIRGLGVVQDGITMRWQATGEVDGRGWLEPRGTTLSEAMEALQARAAKIVTDQEPEEEGV